MNMSTKKEYTIEELEAQYKLADEKRNALKKQIEQKKKEEEELREAQLALEKDARRKEVDESIAKAKELLKAFINDYGIYSFTSTDDDTVFSSRFWNLIY